MPPAHHGITIEIDQGKLRQELTWSEIHKFINQIILEDKLKIKW